MPQAAPLKAPELLIAARADDVPVRLEALAGYLRIYVLVSDDIQHHAELRVRAAWDRFEVELSGSLSTVERRLTCARAVAYIALFEQRTEQQALTTAEYHSVERYALELLLPSHQILPLLRDWRGFELDGDELLDALAGLFKVPRSALEQRLSTLERPYGESVAG